MADEPAIETVIATLSDLCGVEKPDKLRLQAAATLGQIIVDLQPAAPSAIFTPES
jgi:hypothetical protein